MSQNQVVRPNRPVRVAETFVEAEIVRISLVYTLLLVSVIISDIAILEKM